MAGYGRRFVSVLSLLLLLVGVNASPYVRPSARRSLLWPFSSKTGTPDPQQVHVSLAGPKHMKVSWMTSSFTAPSTVEWGTTSGKYDSTAQGENTSYTYVFYKSGLFHHVVVGPLDASTSYYYRCGGAGPEFSFRTPPPAGPQVPITFAVAGDLGQTGWTKSTLDHIQKTDFDVLLFAGDLSYADYMQPLWDSFGQLVQPLASARPWMVTQGNHDVEEIPLLIKGFRSYNARWPMSFDGSPLTSNSFYSFEVAGVHVLMLGSYTDYAENSPQYSWLQADLVKVNRTRTPWLIAMLHAPWYNSNSAHQGDGDAMMSAMEPLLQKAQVDIVFAGHVHAYERTTRVFLKIADPCGIIHITIGAGGNREGLARSFKNPQPSWSLFREASFGNGELRVVNSTHANWSWHRNDNDEQVMADELWMTSLSSSSQDCSFVN
ncbi:hypothetical protein O6H91_12G053500 [Diphasiastrum complanatum]|uniref:Uncharacterized protein n=1 Tax=Diphasiastrum complanatum TaxID=34168 RepID=A0ACC2C1U1_DIPCM|nr:hypothetical protein O6H91_12G053500 [Diphasiastrum complanatum]